MKKILIFAGRYLPGYKDGGPVRTLKNLTDTLGDEYDFRIAVLDRDHGDAKPYSNIKINEWNQVGKAKVWYYRPGAMKFSLIRKLAKDADMVYLCGFYKEYGYKTLILNQMNLLFSKPVVVAAMGTFSKGALAQKSIKKRVFINICKCGGLFKNICWSVTSKYEEEDVKRKLGNYCSCIIAEDLPRTMINIQHKEPIVGEKLRVVFISRISPIKNLSYIAKILSNVQCELKFDIYGILEDEMYWESCKSLLLKLPKNIEWNYCGVANADQILELFSKYDVFLFPSKGENYGHVIFEALAGGCIPIISDRTPWNDIQIKNIGYVIPLEDQERFCTIIETYSKMPIEKRKNMSINAVKFAEAKMIEAKEHTGYRKVFEWRKK